MQFNPKGSDGLLIIEGECPLVSLFSPAQINAVSRIRSLRTASSALNKATLASRPTLPEATAVWMEEGKILYLIGTSYFVNARGSRVCNSPRQYTQCSLEPCYHRRQDNSLQGKYRSAMSSGPEISTLALFVGSIFNPPVDVG